MRLFGIFACVFLVVWYSLSFFLIWVDWMEESEGSGGMNDVWKKSNIPYKE